MVPPLPEGPLSQLELMLSPWHCRETGDRGHVNMHIHINTSAHNINAHKIKQDHTICFTCFSPTANPVYFILLPAILGNPSCGIRCHLYFKSIFLGSSDCAENLSVVMRSGTSNIIIYSQLQKSIKFTSTEDKQGADADIVPFLV